MKFLNSILLLSMVFAITACQKEKVQDRIHSEYFRPAEMSYSMEDTIYVKQLVDTYLSHLNNGDYEAAAAMLYKVQNDSIIPYDNEEMQSYIDNFSRIPLYASKVKYYLFRNARNNEVKILIQTVSTGDIDNEVGVTSLSLNPVLQDGEWFLTLLDKNAEGVEDIYQDELELKREFY